MWVIDGFSYEGFIQVIFHLLCLFFRGGVAIHDTLGFSKPFVIPISSEFAPNAPPPDIVFSTFTVGLQLTEASQSEAS
jgi:hypothetical protein